VGTALAVASRSAEEGAWANMHGRGRLEYCSAGGGTVDFDLCGLCRFGGWAERSGGLRCLGGGASQDAFGSRAAVERIVDERLAAQHATTRLARRDRLAPGAVLWEAAAQQERVVLRQAASGDEALSCLCDGLYRDAWAALHPGALLGSAARIDGHRAPAAHRTHPRFGPENQGFAHGSSVLQRSGHELLEGRTTAVPYAGHVSGPHLQETQAANRPSVDRTPRRRTLPAHPQEPQPTGDAHGGRRLPQLPKGQATHPAKALVRRLESGRHAAAHPPPVSHPLRHRGELSTASPSSHLHLHAQSALALGIRRDRAAAPQPVGLDPRRTARPATRSPPRSPLGATPLQANAPMAQQNHRSAIPRRINTLRHRRKPTATWNY